MKAAPDPAVSATTSTQWIHRWNWGALVFTPLWMLRNGFLLSLLFYLVLGWLQPMATLPISAMLLLWGNRWSWGDGNRWDGIEAFADSQHLWDFVGRIAILPWLIGLLMLYPPIYFFVVSQLAS